jgi:hypothetical protein
MDWCASQRDDSDTNSIHYHSLKERDKIEKPEILSKGIFLFMETFPKFQSLYFLPQKFIPFKLVTGCAAPHTK